MINVATVGVHIHKAAKPRPGGRPSAIINFLSSLNPQFANWLPVCRRHRLRVQCGGMRAHALNLEGGCADSVAWATSLLQSREFCVLDSETTGLKPPVQFVEVAIVDADAKILFEGTVSPVCRIEPGATRV